MMSPATTSASVSMMVPMYLPSARAAIRRPGGRTDLRERQGDDELLVRPLSTGRVDTVEAEVQVFLVEVTGPLSPSGSSHRDGELSIV